MLCLRCSGCKFEVIIIDDGSPDGTQEAAKQLQDIYGKEYIVCRLILCDIYTFVFFHLFANISCDLHHLYSIYFRCVVQRLFVLLNFLVLSTVTVHCV